MTCPHCHSGATRVLDSRPVAIDTRRRRECEDCGNRFTTYERTRLRPTPPAKSERAAA